MRADRIKELAPLVAALLLAALVVAAVATRDRPPLGMSSALGAATPPASPSVVSGVEGSVSGATGDWTSRRTPPGFVVSGNSIAVAPSDGNTVYLCVVGLDSDVQPRAVVGGSGSNQLWVSHDAGRTWTRRADPPITPANQCFLRVDQLDPTIFIVWARAIPLHGASTPAPAALRSHPLAPRVPTENYAAVTFDGGVSWQSATDVDALSSTYALATHNGVTYGLRDTGLAQSTNRMNTWRSIPSPAAAEGQSLGTFWLEPGTNDILLETVDDNQALHLWYGRASANWAWTPMGATYFDDLVVQQPVAGVPTTICGALYGGGSAQSKFASPPSQIFCSTNHGATWTGRVAPALPPPTAGIVQQPAQTGSRWAPTVLLAAITADGTLLLDDHRAGPSVLYRLGPSSAVWEPFDGVPGGRGAGLDYAPGSGADAAGVLWSIPFADDFYTQLDPQNLLATKPYAP